MPTSNELDACASRALDPWVEVIDIAAAAQATLQQTRSALSPLLRRNDYRKLIRNFNFGM